MHFSAPQQLCNLQCGEYQSPAQREGCWRGALRSLCCEPSPWCPLSQSGWMPPPESGQASELGWGQARQRQRPGLP